MRNHHSVTLLFQPLGLSLAKPKFSWLKQENRIGHHQLRIDFPDGGEPDVALLLKHRSHDLPSYPQNECIFKGSSNVFTMVRLI